MNDTMLAGAARREITPSWEVGLAGHSTRTGKSEGVASPLFIRVLALSDGETTLLVGALDALWWPPERADAIRAQVGGELGLDPDHVVLHATHTHTAPQTSAAFAPSLGECDDAFMDMVVGKLIDAGRESLEALTACTMHAGTTNEAIGIYRRGIRDGVVKLAPNHEVAFDDRVRVVQFRSDVAVVATVVHHACHPTTTGDNLISADYPGVLTRSLDASEGGTTLMLQGCAGDVRPAMLTEDGNTFRFGDESDVERLGNRLADAARRALEATQELSPTHLSSRLDQITLNLESGTEVPLRVVRLRLAEGWTFIGLACEPVGRYQQVSPQTWISGYTNGMVGYLPTAKQRHEGGYEPIESLPHFRLDSPFDQQTEQRVVDALEERL